MARNTYGGRSADRYVDLRNREPEPRAIERTEHREPYVDRREPASAAYHAPEYRAPAPAAYVPPTPTLAPAPYQRPSYDDKPRYDYLGYHGRGGFYRHGCRYPGRWWQGPDGPVWVESDVNLVAELAPPSAIDAMPPPTPEAVPIAPDAQGSPDPGRVSPPAPDDAGAAPADDAGAAPDASVGHHHGGRGRGRGRRGYGWGGWGGWGWDGYGDDGDVNVEITNVAGARDDINHEINRRTDERFWAQTNYKPGQRLDRHNAEDAMMIPLWLDLRYDVAQEVAAESAARTQPAAPVARDRFTGQPLDLASNQGVPMSTAVAGYRGQRFGAPPSPAQARLLELASVLAPGARGFTAELKLRGNILDARVCVDGVCYQGSADLALIFAEIEPRLRAYHEALHLRPHAMMGADAVAVAGGCGSRSYGNVNRGVLTAIMHKLASNGAEIAGQNPWTVDTHQHGVQLRGSWDEPSAMLVLEVTDSDFAAPCSAIWSAIDDDLRSVGAATIAQAATTFGAVNDATYAAGQALVGAFVDNHQHAYCAGWWHSLTHPIATIEHAASQVGTGVAHTLKALKAPIQVAAAGAAVYLVGPSAGPMAAQLSGSLIDAANGDASAQQLVQTAQQVAQSNPAVAQALQGAQTAVTQATAAYHAVATVKNAANGDANAQGQVAELVQSAAGGDPAAQQLLSIAKTAVPSLDATVPDTSAAAPDASATDAAASGWRNSVGRDNGMALVGAAPGVRELAMLAVRASPFRVVGYVQPKGNPSQIREFHTPDEADDWFGSWLSMPHAFDYVAYFDKQDPSFPGPLNEQYAQAGAASSGWAIPLVAFALGAGTGYYGPDVVKWTRSKWAEHKAQRAAQGLAP